MESKCYLRFSREKYDLVEFSWIADVPEICRYAVQRLSHKATSPTFHFRRTVCSAADWI